MRLYFAIPAVAAAALSATAAAAQEPVDAPVTLQGQLEESDRRTGPSGPEISDQHRFRLEAGRRYRISASSEDFDTLIRLYQSGEPDPVAENDDHGGSLNSRITYVPEETDDYVLHVLPFSEPERGTYEVRIEALPPLPPPSSARPGQRARTDWRIWEGELAETDPDRDGAYFDDYEVAMRSGETILVAVESQRFDPMVWVLRADEREGEPLDVDDDAGPGTNALLGFQAEEDGRYVVRVTSFGTGGTGGYRLRISNPLTPPPLAPPVEPSEESAD